MPLVECSRKRSGIFLHMYFLSNNSLGCYSATVKRIGSGLVFSLILTALITIGAQSSAQAGLAECKKPKKWTSYTKLWTAFNKNVQVKTSDDWFKAYIFARIYTGYPECFDSKDVAKMKKWVTAYNRMCVKDPSWNLSCRLYSGSGALTRVYDEYK